jgi:hypothetical protein
MGQHFLAPYCGPHLFLACKISFILLSYSLSYTPAGKAYDNVKESDLKEIN